MLDVDFSDPLLRAAATQLAPFYLRLGGSLADLLTYQEADGCAPLVPEEWPSDGRGFASASAERGALDSLSNVSDMRRRCMPSCSGFVRDDRLRVGFRDGCLSRSRWDEIAGFCEAVGCEIILSINALRGRRRAPCERPGEPRIDCRNLRPAPPCCTNYSGAWDSSNAAALLAHAAAARQPLAALAYGNELGGHLAISARLSPEEYARGFGELRALVERMWAVNGGAGEMRGLGGGEGRLARRLRPLVIGPNAQLDPSWMGALLAADPSLPVLSHHLYQVGLTLPVVSHCRSPVFVSLPTHVPELTRPSSRAQAHPACRAQLTPLPWPPLAARSWLDGPHGPCE